MVTILFLECPQTNETLHVYGEYNTFLSYGFLDEVLAINRRINSPTFKRLKYGPMVRLTALFVDKDEFNQLTPVPLQEHQEYFFRRETKNFLKNTDVLDKTKFYSDEFSVLFLSPSQKIKRTRL